MMVHLRPARNASDNTDCTEFVRAIEMPAVPEPGHRVRLSPTELFTVKEVVWVTDGRQAIYIDLYVEQVMEATNRSRRRRIRANRNQPAPGAPPSWVPLHLRKSA